jgi:UPF0755 protein
MTRRRTNCLVILILPLAALICLGGVYGSNYILSLPTQAGKIFGPPAPNLDTITRIRLASALINQSETLTLPADPSGQTVPFEVGLGETVPSVTTRLGDAGIVLNPDLFQIYLQYAGLDTTLQAGTYLISPAMTAIEIASVLQDASPSEIPFRILAGWRIEEIAAALPTSGLDISPEEFLTAARTPLPNYSFSPLLTIEGSFEGFFLPDTYTLPRNLSSSDLLSRFLSNFETQVTSELRLGFSRQGLNLLEAVTLASIIEREAVLMDESPLIASVFLNRLRKGMKLDADPTVQYAIGFNDEQGTWWTNPLSFDDLKIDSPYNTYIYASLPPGPIANPSIEALRAVAFPAQTPYLYFRAACDNTGKHVFAETFEEHKNNACP